MWLDSLPLPESDPVGCVTGVSVWFRSKERPRNDEEWDFRFWPHVGFAPFCVRSLVLVLCSETARKPLLRRLATTLRKRLLNLRILGVRLREV